MATLEELQALEAQISQMESKASPSLGTAPDAAASSVAATPNATPTDPLMAKMAEIDALDASRKDGVNQRASIGASSPADETAAPEEAKKGKVMNFLAGFNDQVARFINAPSALVEEALAAVGVEKTGHNAAKNLMTSLGIVNKADQDSLAAQFGKETFNSIVMAAATLAAAPSLAAVNGPRIIDKAVATLGNLIEKNPGMILSSSVGAVPGTYYGAQAGGTLGESLGGLVGDTTAAVGKATGEAVGGLVGGGITGGLAVAPARRIGNAVTSLDETATRVATGGPLRKPKTPDSTTALRGDEDPMSAKVFAEQQVDAARLKMEEEVADVLRRVPNPGDSSKVAQTKTRALLEKAEEIGNKIVSQFWDRVPLKTRMSMQGIHDDIHAFQGELASERVPGSSSVPEEQIDRILQIGRATRGENGRMISGKPTVQQVRGEIADIRQARNAEQALDAPNQYKIRNLNRLQSILEDGIQAALPGDVTVAQARAASIKYHDIFSRGTLADLLAVRRRGDTKIRPEETVSELIARGEPGFDDFRDMIVKLQRIRNPNNPRTLATTKEDREVLKQLNKQTEDSIRAMFHEQAAEFGPEGAAKFIKKIEPQIRPLAKLSTELQGVGADLAALTERRAILEKSAVAKFSQQDPQIAVRRVYSAQNPAKDARELVKSFAGDIEAHNGLKNGILDEFFTRTQMQPKKMQDMLNDPKTSRMLSEVLDASEYSRLSKMVNIAVKIDNGDAKTLKQMFAPVLTLMGSIFGAQVGRKVAQWTGGGTVQTPGMVSQYMKGSIKQALTGNDAGAMLRNAVRDPSWEKLLLSKEPVDIKTYKETIRTIKRITAGEEMARQRSREIFTGSPLSPITAGEPTRNQAPVLSSTPLNPDERNPTQNPFSGLESPPPLSMRQSDNTHMTRSALHKNQGTSRETNHPFSEGLEPLQ